MGALGGGSGCRGVVVAECQIAEQVVFVGELREYFDAGLGDEDLLFEFDAVGAALAPDEALDAQGHTRHDLTVVASVGVVAVVVEVWVLARHAVAVR